MLRFIVVAVLVCAVHGRRIATSQSGCSVVSDQVNRLLEASNGDFKKNSLPVYTEGISQYINLSWDGTSLPFHVFLNTSKGEMRSLATLHLSSNATKCTDGNHISFEGVFQFDTLELYFSESASSYALPLHEMKSSGTFTYYVKPTVNIIIDKTRDDCHLRSFSIGSTDSVDYKFQPASQSWIEGQMLAYLLQETLRGADTTPLLVYVQEASKDFVESYFTKAWCASLNPSNY
ncbi:hypothetical protein GE061_011100 [Apolygus lucorum]|uniref:Uncharacterized protein n=1 Tax=Apolygus lucorum TaxID=248454 RepID=A0A6A4K9H2_APOLU|nr:hypothetical protein GE061_011100 [Apolygus lucorum]